MKILTSACRSEEYCILTKLAFSAFRKRGARAPEFISLLHNNNTGKHLRIQFDVIIKKTTLEHTQFTKNGLSMLVSVPTAGCFTV